MTLLLIVTLFYNQDEADEMTTEVKQLITNYNNIVSFTVIVYILHNIVMARHLSEV